MAEKVIRNNQSLVPFFGERLSFIRGLDPLGLQNTSDATFSMLLPGLNNVTGRIRYYSFYCWLLDEYSKRNGSTNPEDQKKFINWTCKIAYPIFFAVCGVAFYVYFTAGQPAKCLAVLGGFVLLSESTLEYAKEADVVRLSRQHGLKFWYRVAAVLLAGLAGLASN